MSFLKAALLPLILSFLLCGCGGPAKYANSGTVLIPASQCSGPTQYHPGGLYPADDRYYSPGYYCVEYVTYGVAPSPNGYWGPLYTSGTSGAYYGGYGGGGFYSGYNSGSSGFYSGYSSTTVTWSNTTTSPPQHHHHHHRNHHGGHHGGGNSGGGFNSGFNSGNSGFNSGFYHGPNAGWQPPPAPPPRTHRRGGNSLSASEVSSKGEQMSFMAEFEMRLAERLELKLFWAFADAAQFSRQGQ